jgi:hypothetical protein
VREACKGEMDTSRGVRETEERVVLIYKATHMAASIERWRKVRVV